MTLKDAARAFLAALAIHRAALNSAERRRDCDRLAGNVRKVADLPRE